MLLNFSNNKIKADRPLKVKVPVLILAVGEVKGEEPENSSVCWDASEYTVTSYEKPHAV